MGIILRVRILGSVLFLVLILGCSSAFADPIVVLNPSFEIPILSLGNAPGQTGDTTGTWISYVPGWPIPVGGSAGEYLPSTTSLPSGATDGNDVLWINYGYVSQTLSATLQNSSTYTLQVDVAQRTDDVAISYYIYLMAGNTIIAADNSSLHPDAGTWLTSTLTYTSGANDPLAGQLLTIVLGVNAPQTDFDNVRLDDPPVGGLNDASLPVPEPGAMFLAGGGLVSLLLRRRR